MGSGAAFTGSGGSRSGGSEARVSETGGGETGRAPVPGWPEESAARLAKAAALREMGVDVYPTRYDRTHRLAEIDAAHGAKTLEEFEGLALLVRVAGRVMSKRSQGRY